MSWPRAALFSLSDRTGSAEFAGALARQGTQVLATGGTAKHLADAGVEVTPVETLTGFAEMLGGRVKTLHPHVHAPILARRGEAGDMTALAERGLTPIDLVAVTLYPFEERAAALDEAGAIEEIDIGGVALLRAAAKNHAGVLVIHDPSQYDAVLLALHHGVSPQQRRGWARAAFARTARYDAAIAAELARREGRDADDPPEFHALLLQRARTLRYGENPHQPAALYARAGAAPRLEAWKEGKELSYNNLLDLEAAVALAWRFDAPACVIVKHNQPCGAAAAATAHEAWLQAWAGDPLSAYGGIVAFNRALDGDTASLVARQFVECVAAPSFDDAAREVLGARKNLRVVRIDGGDLACDDPWQVRLVGPWALVQREPDAPAPQWNPVTSRAASADELGALRFAWEVAAHARSNAIALARGTSLVGLGSGQTSRVDAVDVALMKARRAGHDVAGTVLASDGFLPFADNIEHAAKAGVTAVVQPGGSMRDAEVIAACETHGVAMLFTDRRTFRH